MLHPRRRITAVLLPPVFLVPLAVVLAVVAFGRWHAADARRAAAQLARADAALVGRGIESAVRSRQSAVQSLARSPAVRSWLGRGGDPDPAALAEIESTAAAFAGSQLLAVCAKDRSAHAGAGAAAGLEAGRAADAWFFELVPETGKAVSPRPPAAAVSPIPGEPGRLRAAAAVDLDGMAVGAVALSFSAGELASGGASEAGPGSIVALTDEVGSLLHVTGAAAAGASSISDIFPGIERRIFLAAMESPSTASGLRLFGDRAGSMPVVIAAVRLTFADWRVFVAEPSAEALPLLRTAALAGIGLALLALLLVWTGLAAARGSRRHAEELAHEHWKLRETATALEEALHHAREAGSAAARAAEAARGLAGESRAVSSAAEEAKGLLAQTQATLAERCVALAAAWTAAGEAAGLAAAAREAAEGSQGSAARAGTELARLIPASSRAARAAARIRTRLGAVGTLAERARLLALNSSVEAARGSEGIRKLPQAMEEIQAVAGQASEKARGLAAECAAMAQQADEALAIAEGAGHEAEAAARGAGKAASGLEGISRAVAGLTPGGQAEHGTGVQALAADASLADRAGSALEGLARGAGRISAAVPDVEKAAAEAAAAAGAAAAPAGRSPASRSGHGTEESGK